MTGVRKRLFKPLEHFASKFQMMLSVLFNEVLEWYDASVKLIFETLKWDPHKYTIYHSSYGSKSISHVFEVMNQTDVVHEMFLMHQLDLELYSHGVSLNAADLRKTYGKDFIEKHTDCVDPCCSNRSPTKKCSLY